MARSCVRVRELTGRGTSPAMGCGYVRADADAVRRARERYEVPGAVAVSRFPCVVAVLFWVSVADLSANDPNPALIRLP